VSIPTAPKLSWEAGGGVRTATSVQRHRKIPPIHFNFKPSHLPNFRPLYASFAVL